MTKQGRARTDRSWGVADPSPTPPASTRLQIDPLWTPRRLSRAIIGAVRWYAAAGASLRLLFNVASVFLPVVIGALIDAVVVPASGGVAFEALWGSLALWAGVLVGLYVLINIGYRFGGRLGWFGVQRAQFELSQAVLGRALDERGLDASLAPGRLLSIATADTRRACQVLYVAIYPPGEIVGLLVAVGVLFAVHPVLGAGTLILLPVVLGLMHLAARPLRERSRMEQTGLADAAASAADLVAGYRVIRGLHAQGVASQRYRDVSRSALEATLRARAVEAGFEGATQASGRLLAVLITLGAAALAFTGHISAGEVITAAGIAVTLLGPLEALIGTLGSMWAMSQASAERVLDLLRTPANAAALGEMDPAVVGADAALVFQELCLAGGVVLTGRVAPGEFVVIGLPPAARAALSEILSLRARPERGEVSFGGRPLHAFRPGPLRATMLVSPHTPGLLAGTLLDNVTAPDRGGQSGGEGAGDRRTRQGLHVAALSETEVPGGWESIIGDGGWQLSGGQRQRVALARAVAAHTPVLVLDEPTTSVDAVTEQTIATRLRAHRASQTTIVLTTSPAFAAVADRCLTGAEVRSDV